MAKTDSVMSARLSGELDHSFARNGWRTEEVKQLTHGQTLVPHLGVIRGTHRIVEVEKSDLPFLTPVDKIFSYATDPFDLARLQVGNVLGVEVVEVNELFTERFGGLVEGRHAQRRYVRNRVSRPASFRSIDRVLDQDGRIFVSQVLALLFRGQLRRDRVTTFRANDATKARLFVNVTWDSARKGWCFHAAEIDVDSILTGDRDVLSWPDNGPY